MSALVCWNCGENLDDTPRPISRQAACPKCFNEMHCCRLCLHYDPAQNIRCFEDRADPPLQKENANFCEFFSPQLNAFEAKTADKNHSAQGGLNALFGDSEKSATEDGIEPDETDSSALSEDKIAKKKLDDLFG